MTTLPNEYLMNVLSNVAVKMQLTDWHHSVKVFENIGQNYFGVLVPVALIGKRNGKMINFDLVLKLAPTDQRYRVSGALTLFFSKEIYVYSSLLTVYKNLQQSFLSNTILESPEYYYSCQEYCKEVLAIQDMSVHGYKTYTRKFLTFDHIIVSLKELAKLHALSFILKDKNSAFYEEVVEVCHPLTEKTNKRFMNILEDRLDKVLLHMKHTDYINFLKNLRKNYVDYVETVAIAVKGTVICHGDIWKENILFKYKDNTPVSACLIDYQTARLGSPAFDILFLIMTSSDTSLRKEHYKDIINTYYNLFASILQEAGFISNKVYSRDNFEYDVKLVAPASFIIANTALWLASGLQEEGHVRSKIKCNDDHERIFAAETYKSIISAIIEDFSSFGYFTL